MAYVRKEWINAKFHKIEKITDLTWKFTIKLEKDLDYKEGQFANLKVNGVTRSYSIASINRNDMSFELLIVLLEGGELTPILFNEIKEGDPLQVKGPYGHFLLPDEINRDLFFICTGTGLAPFRSFLQYIDENSIPHKKIHLVFGTRKKQDIICYDELLEMSDKLQNLNYIPVLSREEWDGATGYVHKHYLDIIENSKTDKPLFYICGWRQMILETRKNLKNLGYPSDDIICEIYD